MKRQLITGFKVLFFLSIGIGLIWLFMSQLTPSEKEEIWQSLQSADYNWILLSMIFGTLAHLSRAMRWKQLLEPMGHHPSLRNTFLAVMIMYFANLAVPRLGEVTRCAILRRYEKVPMEKSFGTVVAERAIDLVFLGIVFLLTLIGQMDLILEGFNQLQSINADPAEASSGPSWILITLVAGALTVAGILLLFRKHERIRSIYTRVFEMITGFLHGLRAAFRVKKPLVFIGHSFFIWIMYFLMVYVCFQAMGATEHLSWGAGAAILVFGSFGIILVPGGIGIYPLIVAKILLLYQVKEVDGYAFGWIVWIGQTALLIAWGIASFLFLPIFNKKKAADDIPHNKPEALSDR